MKDASCAAAESFKEDVTSFAAEDGNLFDSFAQHIDLADEPSAVRE